jgi:urease accessory protein
MATVPECRVTPSPSPLLLCRRLGVAPPSQRAAVTFRLALTAEERTRLRGHRLSGCGRDLLLQLPRGGALEPGEWLAQEDGLALVQVEPAAEALLVVRAERPLALLQAAYHLGNRHVALELHPDHLRLLVDPVLEQLLLQRGLEVCRTREPFQPEGGAYAGELTPHSHGDDHRHNHDHAPRHGEGR